MKLELILAVAGVAFAQGPGGPARTNSGSGLDMSKIQTIQGAVSAVNIGYGMQYPTIQIGQAAIKVAPVWFLLENGFEIKAGDALKVSAAPSTLPRDSYLSAISLTNTASGATLTLRDANGYPLWTGGAGSGVSQGPGVVGGCLDAATIQTVTGTVDKVTAGLGIQYPTLVLKTADSKLLSIKLGPERTLFGADFEINPGDTLTVKYAATCLDELVALELTNAEGKTIVLRTGDGAPCWR